jgi:hypothetical protein
MPFRWGRVLVSAAVLATTASGVGAATPAGVAAACLRISGGVFDAPGNDNYMPYLNGEYIVIKNACSTARYLTGWRVNDYGVKHTYHFPSGRRIAAYASIKLRSGTGTNTSTTLYWQRSYGAVWNNTPPERAYLRNSSGTLISSWSPY